MIDKLFLASLAFSVASLIVGCIIGKAVLKNYFEIRALLQSDNSGSSNKGDSPLNGGPASDLRQLEGALSHLFNFSQARIGDLSTFKLAQVTPDGSAPNARSEACTHNWCCWGLASRIMVKFPGLYSLLVFLWRWLSKFASVVSFLTAVSLLVAFTDFFGLGFSNEGLSLDNELVSEVISYAIVGASAFCASFGLLMKCMQAIRVVESAWRRRALYVLVVAGVVLFAVYFWFMGNLLPDVWASLQSGLG